MNAKLKCYTLLANVHGHSTFLLALGQNPNLPLHSLTNHQHTHHQIQAKYWHKTQQNSEKLPRALNNNARFSRDVRYVTRDAFFKRADERRWKGSGKVLGKNEQQALVKYESHVYLHPYKLPLEWWNSINFNLKLKKPSTAAISTTASSSTTTKNKLMSCQMKTRLQNQIQMETIYHKTKIKPVKTTRKI